MSFPKPLLRFAIFTLFFFGGLLLLPQFNQVYAALCTPSFVGSATRGQGANISFDLSNSPQTPVWCGNNPDRQFCYWIVGCNPDSVIGNCSSAYTFNLSDQRLEGNRLIATPVLNGSLKFWLEYWDPSNPSGSIINYQQRACGATEWRIDVAGQPARCAEGTFKVVGVRDGQEVEDYTFQDSLRLKFDGSYTSNFWVGGLFDLRLVYQDGRDPSIAALNSPVGGGDRLHDLSGTLRKDLSLPALGVGTYNLRVTDATRYRYCSYTFAVSEDGNNTVDPDEPIVSTFNLCNQIPASNPDRSKCMQCESSQNGIWTAVGCVKASPQNIIATVVRIGMGLAGGVAMLMILAAAFLFSTSQGDPKRTSQARDLVTSAVIGLIFIIFSVTILQFIGVSILQIPDFGI